MCLRRRRTMEPKRRRMEEDTGTKDQTDQGQYWYPERRTDNKASA